VGLVRAHLRADEPCLNVVPQDLFSRLAVLLVHSQKEHRQHDRHHAKGSARIACGVPQNKEQRHAYDCRCTKTDKLPGGQVEGHFGLHLAEIARHGNISCQNFTSLVCAQNAPGDGTSLEQRKAQQHRVPHDAPDRVDGIPGYGNILKQNSVDRHADQNQEALKSQRKQRTKIVLSHMGMLVVAPCCHGHRGKADHHVDLNHSSVDDDENHDGQDAHSDADEEGLQEQPEQWAYVHLHHAGLQHGKPDVVDPCVAGNNAAGICHHLLRHVEHRHDDIESVGDHPDRNGSFEDPFHQQRRLKLCHVVVLCDHLDQLITGDEGQNHACNGKHYVPGQRLDHSENARFKIGWFGADLLCDVAHLGVDVIKQAGEIGHDRRCQQ